MNIADKKSVSKENFEINRIDSFIFFAIAFFYTIIWNWPSTWPIYLSDSVAYLVNAAIMMGYPVDAMGSWHAGYSIFLTPLFMLDDPLIIWKGVLIINALFVSLGVYLSALLLDYISPAIDRFSRTMCLGAVVLYPSFSAIAGYGYSSSIFSINVLLICLLLLKFNTWSISRSVYVGITAGFAFWIHPIGIAVIISTLASMAVRLKFIEYKYIIYAFTCSIVMVFFYKYGIHETMYRIATPGGFSRVDHYQNSNFSQLYSLNGIIRLMTFFAGQISYQFVSSLGMVALCIWYTSSLIFNTAKNNTIRTDTENKTLLITIFSLILLLGVTLLGSVNFTTVAVELGRNDHWIYGRYTDAVIHPVLVIGFLTFASAKTSFKKKYYALGLSGIFAVTVGIYLAMTIVTQMPHSYQSTLSFWPQYLIKNQDYFTQMLLGSFGISLVALIVDSPQKIKLILLLLLFGFNAWISGKHNHENRENLQSNYSQPSALVDLVRNTWPRGVCVGFADPMPSGLTLMQEERFRMYAFFLFNYDYQRIDSKNWKDKCDGPLLTYDIKSLQTDPELRIILREKKTGLFVVGRASDRIALPSTVRSGLGEVELYNEFDGACLTAGCFTMNAQQLSQFTQVGLLSDNKLITTNKSGFLFYGPYSKLKSGNYEIELGIEAKNLKEAYIDIVSDSGNKIHMRTPVSMKSIKNGKIKLSFELNNIENDIEVRLWVGDNDDLSVNAYKINLLIPIDTSLIR